MQLVFKLLFIRLSSGFWISYFDWRLIGWVEFKRGTDKISGYQTPLATHVVFVAYFNKMRAEKNSVALGMIVQWSYCYKIYLSSISKVMIHKLKFVSVECLRRTT